MKTKIIEVDGNRKNDVVSLAFRVKPMADGLYAAEMLLIHGDHVAETRVGVATTLGHAIGASDDLMDGWAFNEIETKPEEYFRNVFL
jgi:hypothetical protein